MFFSFAEDALSRSTISLVQTNAQFEGQTATDFQTYYKSLTDGVKVGANIKCFRITAAEVLEAIDKQ